MHVYAPQIQNLLGIGLQLNYCIVLLCTCVCVERDGGKDEEREGG